MESEQEGKKFRRTLRGLPGSTGDSLLHAPDFTGYKNKARILPQKVFVRDFIGQLAK